MIYRQLESSLSVSSTQYLRELFSSLSWIKNLHMIPSPPLHKYMIYEPQSSFAEVRTNLLLHPVLSYLKPRLVE